MKKLFVAVVAVCMLIGTSVYAHDVDLKSLSDDDLLQLKEDVILEIKDRGIAMSDVLSKGFYVAGKDIAAGRYTVTPAEGIEKIRDAICDSEEAYDNGKGNASKWINLAAGESSTIELKDGEVFVVIEGDTLVTVEEKSSLAP